MSRNTGGGRRIGGSRRNPQPLRRAEYDWAEVPYPERLDGRAELLSTEPDADSPMAGVVAVLWLPDPEQRRGVREFYVRKPGDEKPERTVGFRKPGDR